MPSYLHGHSGFCERVLAIRAARSARTSASLMPTPFCLLWPWERRAFGVPAHASRDTSARTAAGTTYESGVMRPREEMDTSGMTPLDWPLHVHAARRRYVTSARPARRLR